MGSACFGNRMDIHTIPKFVAMAEILMRRGTQAADDPTAFQARAVLENLGPRIQRRVPGVCLAAPCPCSASSLQTPPARRANRRCVKASLMIQV